MCIRDRLASEMGRHVGIERDHSGLEEAARNIEFWDRYISPVSYTHLTLPTSDLV